MCYLVCLVCLTCPVRLACFVLLVKSTMKTQCYYPVQEGAALVRTQAYKDGKTVAKPGIHFTAVEDAGGDYHLFPEQPEEIYRVFRHSWVLVRKRIPDVVVIEGLKLPSCARSAIFNNQYFSLFFRPWTLLSGDEHVPHLSLLGLRQDPLRELYETDTAAIHTAKTRVPFCGDQATISF